MIFAVLVLVSMAGRSVAGSPAVFQPPRDVGCTEWRDCREMALAAADRGEYETFHDLAWRTVQTGPPKDPALMYLLARAQALSGRPHDALVMLRRLAEMGVPSDGGHQRRLQPHAAAARMAGRVSAHQSPDSSGPRRHALRIRHAPQRRHVPPPRLPHPAHHRRRQPWKRSGSRPNSLRSAASPTTPCRSDSCSAIGSGAS